MRSFFIIAIAGLSEAIKQASFSLNQETVDLGWARIGPNGMRALLTAFTDPTNEIQHINLANNFLDLECFSILKDILKFSSKLKSINLANNDIDLEGAMFLAEGLKENIGLERLYLSHTSLQAEGSKLIFEAIYSHSSIAVLDISHCNIGDQGAQAAADLIKRNTSLTTLTIYANDIRIEGSRAVFRSLHENSNIRRLYFGPGNQLSSKAALLLSEYLKWDKCSLQTLDIAGTGISGDSATLLSAALSKKSSLLELSIKANEILKAAVGKRFFTDLSTNQGLRLLDVSACHIDAGASYTIASMIKRHSTLETLNIGYNRLRNNGGQVIFAALKDSVNLSNLNVAGNMLDSSFLGDGTVDLTSTLQTLHIGQNNIGDNGVDALIRSLQNNLSIKRLYLNLYNGITDVGAKIIAMGLVMNLNTSISVIDLSGNKISDTGAEELLNALTFREQHGLRAVDLKLTGNRISASVLRTMIVSTNNIENNYHDPQSPSEEL